MVTANDHTLLHRIFSQVLFSDNRVGSCCWEYTGARYPDGYGILNIERMGMRITSTHAFIYYFFHGSPRKKGQSYVTFAMSPNAVHLSISLKAPLGKTIGTSFCRHLGG